MAPKKNAFEESGYEFCSNHWKPAPADHPRTGHECYLEENHRETHCVCWCGESN